MNLNKREREGGGRRRVHEKRHEALESDVATNRGRGYKKSGNWERKRERRKEKGIAIR